MRLWTIQPVETFTRLQREKVLYVDEHTVPEEFRHAYDWMREQMARRIPGYGGHYPWWGWVNRPDLRRSGHLPPGTKGVRLELEVPDAEVLLSDFDAWHCVLNRSYLALTEEEDEAWEARFRSAVPDPYAWPPPEPWYSEILASWERIFDLHALAATDWRGGERHLQATFECLRLADVRRVKPFVAR